MLRDMGAHDELSEVERRRAGQRRDARRRLHEEEARRLMCSSAGDELSRSIWRPLSLGAEAAMGLMETMDAVHARRGPRYAEKMHRALKRACTASPLSYLNPDLHNLSEYALVMKSRETYESTCDLREESYRQYVVRLRPIELGAAEEVLHHLRQILHYATEDQVLGPSRRLRRKSQAIYDFLEWARGEHGLLLASYATSSSPLEQGRLFPSQHSVRRLLAEFFEIDEEKIEQEKRAMLEGLRG